MTTKCPDCGCPINGENVCPDCGHIFAPVQNDVSSELQENPPELRVESQSDNTATTVNNHTTFSWEWVWNIDLGQYIYESFMIMKHTYFKKFFCFHGRATRREFWSFTLLCNFIPLSFFWVFPVVYVMILATFFPALGVTIRRLHDNGRSGWWSLIPPFCLFYTMQRSNPNSNGYGASPINDKLF